MNKVDKLQLLEALENQVENHLKIAIHAFQNLDEVTLLEQPIDGGWSITQCFEHLNSYGQYYLPQIEKAMKQNHSKSDIDAFKSSWLGNYFTNMMLPTNTKKYKAFKGHIPAKNLDAHVVMTEFINQQETMLRYLKEARQVNLDAIRVPISITKWVKLKLGDVFRFIIAHDERHIQQAGRVLGGIKSMKRYDELEGIN